MARPLVVFLMVLLVISGLCRDLCGQDKPESGDAQAGRKPQKTRLFELPGFSGKISQGAFGAVFDALRDKRVQQEIGLLPAQLKELLRLNEEVMKELGPLVENFNQLPKAEQEAKVEELRKELASYMKGLQAAVDKILVPEQQQRLRQVAFQLRLQKGGAIKALTDPEVLRELGFNNAQAERFRENVKTIEEEHRSKLAELEIEKEQKVLGLFSANQRNRLEWMIGTSMPNPPKAPTGSNAPRP